MIDAKDLTWTEIEMRLRAHGTSLESLIQRWTAANREACPECGKDGFPYKGSQERICHSCSHRWLGSMLTRSMPTLADIPPKKRRSVTMYSADDPSSSDKGIIDIPGVGVVGHSMPVKRCDACRNSHHANCTGFLVNGDLCGCECRK